MAATDVSIRSDFPEFASTTAFPTAMVVFWLNVANMMINQGAVDVPAPFASVAAVIAAAGTGYVVGEVITLGGGQGSNPTTIQVLTIGGGGSIATYKVASPGMYWSLPTNPAPQLSTTGVGTGATFNLTYTFGANTMFDVMVELFVAHNLALEEQAINSANVGGVPGVGVGGIVSSKSVGGVSISYDTTSGIETDAGHWNLTTYGKRFMRFVKIFGAGPAQLGVGCDPCALNGPGWPGVVYPYS